MFNVCRCCLSADRCSRDIFCENQSAERPEVYGDMLKETLNIEISNRENHVKSNTLICDNCVARLQDASAFKTMVLHSEKTFELFLNGYNWVDNLEIIKKEDINSDDDRLSVDNEPLDMMQEMKDNVQERIEKNSVIHLTQESPRANVRRMVKNTSNSGDIKSNDDWTKLKEQRGDGPLLRENSLTLLENSTIFTFQWHKSKYTCFCCQKPFLNMEELRNHSTGHPLKDIEKKIITTQNMLVKVEVSFIKCKLCCNILEDLQELRSHLSIDHNFEFRMKEDLLVPFKIRDELECQICNEQFLNFRLLNIHMNKHYKKQVCHTCGAAFSNLRFLTLHRSRLHRLWKCGDCNLEFSSKTEKRHHDVSIHKIKAIAKNRFPCPHCEERYYQESCRILHLVEKHGLRKPEHKCSLCPKTFITRSLCNNHFKSVHKKERKHSCDICNNMFYTKSDVARHRVTHTGEKSYMCVLCNAPFATKDSLRRHMKRTHAATQIKKTDE